MGRQSISSVPIDLRDCVCAGLGLVAGMIYLSAMTADDPMAGESARTVMLTSFSERALKRFTATR